MPQRSLRFWLVLSTTLLVALTAALNWGVAVYFLREIVDRQALDSAAAGQPAASPPMRELLLSFLATSLASTLIALAAAVLVGRRLVSPLKVLQAAASRFGRGDLLTPIPRLVDRELAELAGTLEEARIRLNAQTAELVGREEEARSLLLGIVEGVVAVDAERRLRYLTPRAERLLGVRADEVLGHFCGDVLLPRPVQGRRPCEDSCPILLARSLDRARAVETLRAGGRSRDLVLTASRPAGGRQVVLLRDETEEEAGRRARDAFLANVSHELKTPVAGQLASIELLQEGENALQPAERTALVDSLQRSTLRLLRLIDNLLESVRLELLPAKAADLPVDLDEMLDEAVDFVAPLLRQRGQSLRAAWPRPLPPGWGEQASLTRVFVNLLANAHHAAPEGSEVELGARVEHERLVLWVTDQGPGLPKAAIGKLFERFQQGEQGPGRGGLGLGLWIAKNIVERHGGSMTVGDAGGVEPQRGARFEVALPRRVQEREAP
jgi:signal transduction histidine kinase/HAMP domain-containing protein